MVKKKTKSVLKKQKTERDYQEEDSDDARPSNGRPSTCEMDKIQEAIIELREKGKCDPNIDFNKELRRIQDQISDYKGEARRPITAVTEEQKKSKKRVEIASDDEENSDSSAGEDDEEEEEDPDKEIKEMINRRLTSMMLLCVSFESEKSYPKDFYEKLADSHKFQDVISPITKEERKMFNKLLKEKKGQAKKRIDECRS